MAPQQKNPRLQALRRSMKDRGLDAFIVRNLLNIRYLCGFIGTYGVLVVDSRKAVFTTDSRYAEMADSMVTGARIVLQPSSGVKEHFQSFFRKQAYARIGFEGSISFNEHALTKDWVRPGKSKLEEAEDIITRLRRIKDDGEVRIIAKAARLADRMMAKAWELIGPGATETEISLAVRRACEDGGGEGESFPNIIASGPNASRPHHHPLKRRMRKGDMVTVDLGALVDGYCSDMTRTPIIGRPSRKFEEIYRVCLEAQEAGVAACVAGAACKDVDGVAREIISSAGYGKYFGHGLGHGVGLQIHEAPRLSPLSKDILEPGDIVTVEPGIYIPGYGGLRIEDLLLVTKGKPRVLSRTPKGLTIIPV